VQCSRSGAFKMKLSRVDKPRALLSVVVVLCKLPCVLEPVDAAA
jgi:hypothetical protein